MKKLFLAALAACLSTQAAFAAFDLRVTEVWPGNTAGDDLTDDWFEVTNFGDMPWVASTDGDLYFEDDSADADRADLISGVASIAPGESVIFVDGLSDPQDDLNLFLWRQVWNGPLTTAGRTIPQLGTYNGSGLSGTSGDAVALFLDSDLSGTPEQDELLLTQPHAGNLTRPGQSFDTNIVGSVTTSTEFQEDINGDPILDNQGNLIPTAFDTFFGAFTTTRFGIVTAPNGNGEPAIASPGFLPVPEPTSVGLISLAIGMLSVAGRRRK